MESNTTGFSIFRLVYEFLWNLEVLANLCIKEKGENTKDKHISLEPLDFLLIYPHYMNTMQHYSSRSLICIGKPRKVSIPFFPSTSVAERRGRTAGTGWSLAAQRSTTVRVGLHGLGSGWLHQRLTLAWPAAARGGLATAATSRGESCKSSRRRVGSIESPRWTLPHFLS